jgi:tRNA(fMet)-specific endonuclease VapC
MRRTYMLDTCICSYIMRQQPASVLQHMDTLALKHNMVISAISYAELRLGAAKKQVSPKHNMLIDQLIRCLDGIYPWDSAAIDQAIRIKSVLESQGTPIGLNDTYIAAHAIASGCILVTHNMREFERVPGLQVEDWVG